MKQIYLLIFSVIIPFLSAHTQYSRHIIELTDKNGTAHTLNSPGTYLSAKAIERRNAHAISIDSTDLPIPSAYLDSIAAVGNVVIYNKSKWLNQVLIRTNDPAALARISEFAFVKGVKKVSNNSRRANPSRKLINEEHTVNETAMFGTRSRQGTSSIFNYGNSSRQIQIHEGQFLHSRGYTGKGMDMAVMDAGFQSYLTNPAFDSVRLQSRILGTWDYVNNEPGVNEDHHHGSDCFSIMAANRPGSIVGSAPHASYWLFRTEDVFSEMPVEEQNWIAAAEFADSAGAWVFSTSLGYNDFDDPTLNYSYAERDGNTAMMTRAADLAAKKGILVMNSAGNFGNRGDDARFVLVPADGDSVITVGAVDVNGMIGAFSSRGPNAVGKMKPNFVSVGVATVYANGSGNAVSGNGTSFSNPNLAGLMTCLWQAFPERSNMQIVNAVEKTSSRFTNPDAQYGYGIPNFRKAYQWLMSSSLSLSVQGSGNEMKLQWTIKDDSSVSYLVQRRLPGKTNFEQIDSIKVTRDSLQFSNYSFIDSSYMTVPGNYSYRLLVRIGTDTSFLTGEFELGNRWPSMIADSLKLSVTLRDCVAGIRWEMPENEDVVYKLERQNPGTSSFLPIATINGAGSNYTNKVHEISEKIKSPLPGQFNYRLQVMLGQDTSFYSNTVSALSSSPCYDRTGYFFTPSPFNKELLAVLHTMPASTEMNVLVHDLGGRLVHRYRGSKPAGYFHVRIPTGQLSAGIYVASIMLGRETVYRQRIVK